MFTDLIRPSSGKALINGANVHTHKKEALASVGTLWSILVWRNDGPLDDGRTLLDGGGYGYPSGLALGFSVALLVVGTLVILCAIMINARPREHMAWGIIVLVFSIISFIGMGGFMRGALHRTAG